MDRGSAGWWGPLFGARARDWADTWEGPAGWGTAVYEHVLNHAGIGPGTRVLDCGCGAGRFAGLAAGRGATVAGIDAAGALVEIARERAPAGDFRVGDLEDLPWPDAAFDVVTGLSSFQFAQDPVRALGEARRTARRWVVVVVPTRVPESGIPQVVGAVVPLLSPTGLQALQASTTSPLSGPAGLETTVAVTGLRAVEDHEVASPTQFDSVADAVRAFLAVGPVSLAIEDAGEGPVADVIRRGLRPFVDRNGRVLLPGWYRVVVAEAAGAG